jgi:PAS domain S-box-containing protein
VNADVAVGQWSNEFAEHGLFTTDEHLTITSWNRWLERHSGIRSADAIGQALTTALPDVASRGLDERYRDALDGKAYLVSHLLHGYLVSARTIDGSPMPQRARIAPLRSGGAIVGTITVIEDVSERVASEQELRRQIAAQQTARAAAEEALRVKDDFLAMLGHELRNPLAPILMAVDLMKLRGAGNLERERAIIERQAKHLVALVSDLLDISRIARGKLEIRRDPVDIGAIISEAVEMASPLVQQRRHAITVAIPPARLVVTGDAQRLSQVFANLLTNAAKYTEPGGAISVRAELDGQDVIVRVRDTGIGMDQEMIASMFEPFVQATQTIERSRGGLGLGLTIVRSILRLHGGSISASSPGRDQGSEFAIRLPLVEAEATVDRTDASPPPGVRVLVVDDNEDGAILLSEALAAAGYQARFALDGLTALELAEEFIPDIAILDIGLPVVDGYELARRFARHPRLSRTRLVAVTGYGQPEDRQRSAKAGFAAHLVKPVDLSQLHAILEAVHGRVDAPEPRG